MSQYQFGNNLWRQSTFNNHLQPNTIVDAVNNSVGSELWNVSYNWGGKTNNGNLIGVTYNNGGLGYAQFLSFTEIFQYDGVNRLTSATDTGATGGWSQSYGYDAFGNMWESTAGLPMNATRPVSNVYNGNNQMTTASYDGGGNQTTIPNLAGAAQTYDAENRITQVTGSGTTAYAYDGEGRRVLKAGTSSTVYVYDALGQLAAEYSTSTGTSPCLTCYLSSDHLGSTRLVTDSAANVIGRHDFTSFGEEIPANTAGRNSQWGSFNDAVNQKFTGQLRDTESGFDYFGARYYGSALGRFTSPDWSAKPQPVPYANFEYPQTLNGYAYARNNPLSKADADGHCADAISCSAEAGGAIGSFIEPGGGTVVGAVIGAAVGAIITVAVVHHVTQAAGRTL